MHKLANNPQTLVDNLTTSASASPEKIAFRFDGTEVSYAQLLRQSSQLAALLDVLGVAQKEPVALLLPRCLEAATAIYGTMYCGCVWVPIDPASPVKVVRQILAQCGIRVILSHPQMAFLLNQLAVGDDEHSLDFILGLDQAKITLPLVATYSWSQIVSGPPATFSSRPVAKDAAYVIHTSGSTGDPKGIVHTHKSGSSYARLAVNTFGLCDFDVIGSHGPLHTDMCTMGFLAGPLAGSTTQIVSDAHVKVPASLSAIIEQSGITVWYSVPQVIVQLVNGGVLEERDLSKLRWLIYAGESLAPGRLLEFLEHVNQTRVCNVYGPAESNQCLHYFIDDRKVLQALVGSDKQVPIGNVWPETEAILLDENDKVVEASGQGELAVRSSTLMYGYWHDSRADSEIYYDCPLTKKRYYRTGDLARCDATGVYTLVGRIGRQIKVRGMRVELDAIELLLCQHPSVAGAAVITILANDDPGSCSILAAVTLNSNHATKNSDGTCSMASVLLSHLRQHLPTQAVPQSIEIRSSIPLTSGGKIDRLRLSNELQRSLPH